MKTVAAAFATVLIWSAAFPAIRVAVRDLSPGEIAFARVAVAAIVLLPLAAARGLALPDRGDRGRAFAAGALGVGLYSLVLTAGLREVDPGTGAMIVNSAPLLVAVASVALLGERATGSLVAGIALGLLGATLMAVAQERVGVDFAGGTLLVVLAAGGTAYHAIATKPLLARTSPIALSAFCCAAAALCLLPFAPGLIAGAVQAPRAALLAASLGLGPTAIGYVTWSYVLGRLPAGRAATLWYAIPPFSIAVSWLTIGETPPPLAVVGGAIALVGVAIATAPVSWR